VQLNCVRLQATPVSADAMADDLDPIDPGLIEADIYWLRSIETSTGLDFRRDGQDQPCPVLRKSCAK
jgi:hypothetical protein